MYRAPVSDIAFALKHVAGLGDALAAGAFPHLAEDVVDAVLAEAGRFASEEMAPLSAVGDREGARLKDGVVATAPGWRDVYTAWCAGGWNGIAAPEEAGGQGLPLMLSAATQEMWNGACHVLRALPHAHHGRGGGALPPRHPTAEDALPAAYSSPANGPAP